MKQQIPPKVYKYYAPAQHNMDALSNGYFWFSKRKYLNDPYDCYGEIIRNYPSFCQKLGKIRDIDTFTNILEHYGICCFTESALNPTMWASYADSYKGWVLEFESDCLIDAPEEKVSPKLYRMHYLEKDEEYPNLDDGTTRIIEWTDGESFITTPINGFFYQDKKNDWLVHYIINTKAHSWEYEQEYRLLLDNMYLSRIGINHDGGYKIPWKAGVLKRIIMGHNASFETKTFLITMACLYHIPIDITYTPTNTKTLCIATKSFYIPN